MPPTTPDHYGCFARSGPGRCHSGVTPPTTVDHSVIDRGWPPKRLGGLPFKPDHYGRFDRSGPGRCHSGVTPPATVDHSVIDRGWPPKRLGGLPFKWSWEVSQRCDTSRHGRSLSDRPWLATIGLGGLPSPMVATGIHHYGQNDRSGSWRCHSGVTPPATVDHSVIDRGRPPKRLGGLPSPMVATTTPNHWRLHIAVTPPAGYYGRTVTVRPYWSLTDQRWQEVSGAGTPPAMDTHIGCLGGQP
ncbi:hypothetical protein DFH28DRAFT_1125564 [Melampsora americana]|nr:hypothetical protein DFH28DRAFT_1125564 [Melampsora americana]